MSDTPSYPVPDGIQMPERCHYCEETLCPEDYTSGRCEWCRMPWVPLAAPEKSCGDYFTAAQKDRRIADLERELREAVRERGEARAEVLRYALAVVENRRTNSRPDGYMAALDDVRLFLEAAVDRVEAGEGMAAAAEVQ